MRFSPTSKHVIRNHHRRERILAAILVRHGRAALEAVALSLNLIRGGAR